VRAATQLRRSRVMRDQERRTEPEAFGVDEAAVIGAASA